MSSRERLADRVADTIADGMDDGSRAYTIAVAVVDKLMPVITEPKQMKDVPERSILVVPVMGGVVPVRWQNGFLYGDLRADKTATEVVWAIDSYGPLTVVWMP